ncbi:MAG: DUF1641 domain-containing protein [Candidatus Korarchaeota archaeon]|nr:DUF1641 domain-containing protein [Candidatus Korarchaeota archaeon]
MGNGSNISLDEKRIEKLDKLLDNADRLIDTLSRMEKLLDKLELFSEAGLLDDLLGLVFGLVALQRGFIKEEAVKAVAELMQAAGFVMAPECLKTVAEYVEKKERVVPTALMERMSDPDFQRGLAILLNAVTAIGKCASESDL